MEIQMKYTGYIALLLLLAVGCDSENAPQCLKTSGKTTEVSLVVDYFNAIEINTEFNVILKEGPAQAVTLTAGANLIPEIVYEVVDGTFIIRNKNSCQWVRSYNYPLLTIIHPDITRIRQGGSGLISSEGALNYPKLTLLSEEQTGDFQLELHCDQLSVTSNELSNFHITGTADVLRIFFASGDGRFEGADFKVKNATIKHRGTNDIIVYVTETLTGEILSTGNIVYVKTQPTTLDVSDENLGELIYKPE
ncbi:hypothetical protein C900_02215 [Fulvivirga imtechensis AK7]|uniref:Putative auto-transporter adhesin head GIN domain-containing protein n=1 Tax=Fulvivirga imtechensis AK7 TaxID=1237149 RepID=L8JSM0_9BACT|nr:head GIN domain-containing protein [Fulvivirga imtechensis]ELR71840.1 hypothetical protein C900_02215 [Fulvivirga imtechensis AK7]